MFPYSWGNTASEFTFTSVLGHLKNNDFPERYASWHSVDPLELFDAPIVESIREDMEDVKRNLQIEARHSSHLFIWTDCDREGEHIGYEVATTCREANPSIIVLRARFSSVIASEVTRACQNPNELDMRLVHAVLARQEVDLRVGAALTRLQSTRLQRRFEALKGQVISYGQ